MMIDRFRQKQERQDACRMTDSGLLHCGWSVEGERGPDHPGPLHALWGAWHCIMSSENQGYTGRFSTGVIHATC